MHIEIRPLRRCTFKLNDRDQVRLSGDLIIGQRWITSTRTKLAAKLRPHGSVLTGDEHLIAVIYEPEIKALRGADFLLSGWEILNWKADGIQAVLQEWACTLSANNITPHDS